MARRLAISKHLARILLDCRQWVTLRPLLLRIATTSASGKDRGQLLHLCLHQWLKKRQRRMYAARTRRTMSTRYVYESLSPIMVRHVSHCNLCEGAPCSFFTLRAPSHLPHSLPPPHSPPPVVFNSLSRMSSDSSQAARAGTPASLFNPVSPCNLHDATVFLCDQTP